MPIEKLMKHILFYIFLVLPLFFLSCSDNDDERKDPLPPFYYETVAGNTYILHTFFEYHLYTFNADGTIDIEVRNRRIDGELLSKGVGYYEYNHPVLKLTGEIGCTNCNNKFEVKVSDSRRNFSTTLSSGIHWDFFVYDYHSWDDYK